MLYYWLIFVLFLLFVLGGSKSEENKKNVLRLIIPLTCLFIFFAFRIGFTPDYYNYENEFDNNYGASFNNERYQHASEVIHLTFIRIVPYRTALIIQSALFCICMFVTFWYYVPSKNWWLAVVLFFTYSSFLLGNISAYRSSYVTMALFLAVIAKAHFKRGWVFAFLIIYVSSLIHHSAIFLFPFVLLSKRPVTKNIYNFLFVLACVVIFLSLFMANTINAIANGIFKQFTDDFGSYKKDTIENVTRFGYFTFLRWLMLGYLLFVSLKYTKIDFGGINNICTKIAVILFMVDFLPGILLIDRITYNLSFPAIIGVTSIANKMTDKKEKTIYISLAVLYGIWEIYLMSTNAKVMAAHSIYQNILFN